MGGDPAAFSETQKELCVCCWEDGWSNGGQWAEA